MSALRDRLIEAGAREVYEVQVRRMQNRAAPKLMLLPEWDELGEDDREHRLRHSAGYLDAFLDTLEANADEVPIDTLEVFVASDGYNGIRPTSPARVVKGIASVLRDEGDG